MNINEGRFEPSRGNRPPVDDRTALHPQVRPVVAPQPTVSRQGEPFTEGVNYWPQQAAGTVYTARTGLPVWLHLLYAFVLGPLTCGVGWAAWLAHWIIVQKKTTVVSVPPSRGVVR